MKKIIKTTIHLLIFFLVPLLPFYGLTEAHADDFVSHVKSSVSDQSRYEIVQSSLAAKWTFKLDKYTGDTYQLTRSENDSLIWSDKIWRTPNLPDDIIYPNRANYQIFLSGIAATHTYLININSGRVWVLDELLGLSWDPIFQSSSDHQEYLEFRKKTDNAQEEKAKRIAMDKREQREKAAKNLPKGLSRSNPYKSVDEVKKAHLPDDIIIFIEKDDQVIRMQASSNSTDGITFPGVFVK